MNWKLTVCLVWALIILCKGQPPKEDYRLSQPGYHLCKRNETRIVSYTVQYLVPYTVMRPCVGWIPGKTCPITKYRQTQYTDYKTVTEQVIICCDGYSQVGHYCGITVNRSREIAAKPGFCPTADGLYGSEGCEWDMDCLGWQKCCQTSSCFACTDPTRSGYFDHGVSQFNATVTVKVEYQDLMREGGLLNHIRLLYAMIIGVLESNVSIHYLDSQPVYPYRSATSLMIRCKLRRTLNNVTFVLQRLLKDVQEVTSVAVDDIDECAQPFLHQCSPHGDCVNTIGFYYCTCRPGYTDVDPANPGTNCTALSTIPPPITCFPPMNTTSTPDGTGITTKSQDSMNTTLDNTTYAPTTPYISETTTSSTTCSPSSITILRTVNVTSSSFRVYWSSQFPGNHSYRVVVSKGAEVIFLNDTSQATVAMSGLQAGALYQVTVTPYTCGTQGNSLQLTIKTDAQTLDATARLTNIEYTSDLQNASSTSYLNLTASIYMEIYRRLSPEIRALVDAGRVRIQITGFAPGSVFVNFTLIFILSQSEDIANDIANVSSALINSLKNSSKFDVDANNTKINDRDECTSGENDCSPFATCNNTWGAYTCVCLTGFVDSNAERPGRSCQAIVTTTLGTTSSTTIFNPTNQQSILTSETISKNTESTTLLTTKTVMSTVEPVKTTHQKTTITAPVVITTTTPLITSPVSSTTTQLDIKTVTLTVSTMLSTTTAAALTTTPAASATTAAASTTITAALTTTAAASTTTPTALSTIPTASTTTAVPSTTSPASLTTTAAPSTTSPASLTTTAAPLTTSPASLTTTAAPSTTSPASLTTTAAPLTTTASPLTTSPASLTTTAAPSTTSPASLTTSPASLTTTATASTTTTYSTTMTTDAMTTAIDTMTTITAAATAAPAVSTTTAAAPTTVSAVTTTADAKETTITTTPPPTSTEASTSSLTTTTSPATKTNTSPMTTTGFTTTQSAVTTTTTTTANRTFPSVVITTNISASEAIAVKCDVASITVTVAKDFLQSSQITEAALYLGMADCGVSGGNATHAQLTVAWDKCNTLLVHNDSYYTASVTLFNSMNLSSTRQAPKIRLEIPVKCTYMKSMLITSDFGSMGFDMIKDVIVGSGIFQVSVQLMNGTVPLPHNFSLPPSEPVVVVVSLNTSVDKIKVVINKCWATPTPNPSLMSRYIFIENRCSINPYTTVITNGNSSTSNVSVQIFSFVDLSIIYLHCQVEICVEIGSASCAPDCLQRTSRSGSRSTIGTALATSGPLFRDDEDPLEEGYSTASIIGLSCLGVGLGIFFIIGFVCLFYYQRNRIGHYNFNNNNKPKEENFTYLTFST